MITLQILDEVLDKEFFFRKHFDIWASHYCLLQQHVFQCGKKIISRGASSNSSYYFY